MRTLLLLNCYLFLIGYSLAENAGGCDITGISDDDYVYSISMKIDDTQVDTIIAEYEYTGTLAVTDYTTTEYFAITSNSSHFIIRTTAQFANFDEDTPKQALDVVLENLNIFLQCSAGTSTLPIQIAVTDINTHPPVFSLSNYEFRVAAPIMPLTDFTVYGESAISAVDVDFSNQNIVFTVSPDDFEITTISTATSKNYTAVFRANRVIQVIGVRTYTIVATDTGTWTNPTTMSQSAQITLIVDDSTSLDTPAFVRTSYSFNYTAEDGTPNLISLDGPISIRTNKRNFLTDPTLTGDFSQYFDVTLNRTSVRIEVTPNGLLLSDTGSFFILTVSISTDNTAAASIIVYRKQSEIDNIPEFSSHVYTGSYSDVTGQVTLNDIITVTSATVPQVNISGAYSDNFKVIYDAQTSSYQISVSANLPGSEIKSHSYISFIIMASTGENYDTAAVILSLPEHELLFTDALYIAEYNSDNTVTIDDANPIGFTTDVSDVTITVTGTYEDNFRIIHNSQSNRYSIEVSTPLSSGTLNAEELIDIVLTATDSYGDVAQSVVSIYLPNIKTDAPTLSEIIYLVEYTDNDVGSILAPDHDIFISNRDNQENIKISLDSYNSNFDVTYNTVENKWELKVLSPLPENTLLSRTDLIITMTAEEQDNANKGHAILDISWTTEEAPIFSEAYYLGHYPDSGTGVIELNEDIDITNIKDPTNVVITLDSFAEYFDITYSSNRWIITKILPDYPIVSEYGELVLTLTATETGNKNVGQSILVLDLPDEKQGPIFLDAYYLAEYPASGVGVIEFQNPIEFLNVNDPNTIQINLDNYATNFEIIYDTNRWYINIIKSLDDTDLYRNVDLVITLIATESGNVNQGESALVLKLPASTDGDAPKFSEAYYTAEYPEDGTGIIEFDNDISFLNVADPSSLTLTLDNYASYFDIVYQSNKWHINIRNSLDYTVLHQNVELIMTIFATESGNTNEGESALVLKLPTATYGTAPKFSDAYYIANYPENGFGTIDFTNAISFINVDEPARITITLDKYAANFEVIYDTNKFFINIKSALNDTVLRQNVELVMTLTATEAGNQNRGESALVLKLPTTTNGLIPTFAEAYYLATYPEVGTGIIEFETPISFLNVDNPTSLTISLNSYSENFKIVYGSNRWYISITDSLQNSVLNRNAELVMTMIASETGNNNNGKAALVLKLPTVNNDAGPIFSQAHYEARYIEDGTGYIEFDSTVSFLNVDNPTTVTISLDSYSNYFDIMYGSNRWVIKLKNNLDETVLSKNAEIVVTMIATETGTKNEGYSALILKLPAANSLTAPKFSEAYYVADYAKITRGVIEFENPIEFLNVNDPATVKISLDYYTENFQITYDARTARWYINVNNRLDNSLLTKTSELIMTMIATESGNDEQGESALVLKLPAVTDEAGPIFSEAHYEAEYTERGNGFIEFDSPITFLNVDDPTTVTINLDTNSDNFDIIYGSNRWLIRLKTNLDSSVLTKNAEIVITMIAVASGNKNEGYSALVLRLPSANSLTAPKFSEAYYLADYSKISRGVVEFEKPVTFLNVEDPTAVTVTLDYYSDNFEIRYDTDTARWYIQVNTNLDSNILNKNAELVITMVATTPENDNVGESALVLKLPTVVEDIGPIFSEAYYEAEYIDDGTEIIEFGSAVTFLNVDDPTTVTISVDTYSSNFDILYGSNRWFIKLNNNLDRSVLLKNTEIVMTMTAIAAGNLNKGYSALVLKLPSANSATAPKFSEAYYLADYSKITAGIIEFEQPITFLNVEDPATLKISLDYYSNNFEIEYDTDTSKWYININDILDNSVLTRNTELVMTMIATEPGNDNKGESALVLKLPAVTEDTGPIFSEAYYEAEYKDDGVGIIEFESAVTFLNVDDPTTVKIHLDRYSDNFDIIYGANRWYIRLKTNLERSVLLRNTEIAIAMIATATGNANEGYSALVLKLPSGKSVTAPKFSEAYYVADYSKMTGGVLEFETPIQFLNIDDPATVKIGLDYYSNNFEITYNTNTARWYININDRLENSVLTKNAELVMTMSATESGNNNRGEAALVLKLPTVTDVEGPVFSEAYYEAEYVEDVTGIIEFENAIIFLNIDDPTGVTIDLDSYSTNFDIIYGASRWYIRIKTTLDASLLAKTAEIVMTMTATATATGNVGYSALVLKLPSANSLKAPKFSEAYYLADYSKISAGIIEFENLVTFVNIEDAAAVKIRLDSYSDNFAITYDTNSARWYININNRLDSGILSKNAELVLTMIATETGNDSEGEAALVLKLPPVTDEVGPIFSEAYYEVEYTEDTGVIEFKNPIIFLNVDDPTTLTIELDNYSNYFNIAYASNRWYISIKTNLDAKILTRNTEITTTMAATVTGNKNEGHSALVIKLPSAKSATAPKFSEAYYSADYSKITGRIIEFENPITFVNVDNPSAITISLDYYSNNFDIRYDTNTARWYINVNTGLDNTVLSRNAELVITMIATEIGNDNQGESALVLKLPTVTEEAGPIFSQVHYEATYVEDGTGIIQFDTAIAFLNVASPATVRITLDKYSDNFDVAYGSRKWYLLLKNKLNETVLTRNSEIVMTMTASQTGTTNEGHSALVLKLPSTNIVTAPKFSKAYYLADYSKINKGIIELEDPITFINADPAIVTISLDNYSDKFEIIYDIGTERWYINVKNNLDDTVLSKNAELVITLTAREAGNENEGYSSLVIELPVNAVETSPVFADAYYIVDYPESGNPNIQFEIPIAFKNINDPRTVTITLDNYSNNFEIDLILNKWYITIKNPLDNSVLNGNTELVMSLIATENGKDSKGYSALVLNLPLATVETPPIFSRPIYSADYKISNGQAVVEFTDAIHITSKSDLSKISITVDNYPANFNVEYNSVTKAWVMNVVSQISDEILLAKTDLVVAITAIDTTNGLTDQTVVDLKLPPLNSQTSPKFSKTYYTAKYTISGATPVVTFDVPLTITNRDNLADISISVDPYVDNFNIIYDLPSQAWKMNVLINLDEAVLNAKVDLVMTLLATDKSTGEIGESALVLTLPIVNNDEAPKFSSIYYSGEYKTDNGGTIDLESTILITNKNDLTAITISFDDSYRNNFEIRYDSVNSKWVLNIRSPLDDLTLRNNADLILTLTATERNNPNIGQAALLLHLPAAHVKLAPKFALAHYSAQYAVNGGQGLIILDKAITIINKEDLDSISVTLDSYSSNFKLNYDSSKEEWTIGVTQLLPDRDLNSNTELILTLLANENENENIGDSTLILSLPSSQDNSEGNLIFSQVHYSAEYDVEGNNNVVKMNDEIKVTSKLDVSGLTVKFENDEYAEYFDITPEDDKYVVIVKKPLTPEILSSTISIALTIVASADTSKSYATVVINLPATVQDRAIEFVLTLYNAIYKIDDGSFQVSDTIRVETETEDANVEYSISSSIGYEQYFEISYSAKIITVKAKEIPANLLRGRSVIPLLLTVGIIGTLDSSTAVLNVQVENNDEDYTPILLSNVLYHGKYEVTDGIGILTVYDDIRVDTDEADGNVEVSITNEYDTYFGATYSNRIIDVSLRIQLPTSILSSHSFIPVTLQVGVKGTTNQASAVLNIEIIYDSEADTGSIEFTTVLYGGVYSVSGGTGVLVLNETIQVITDSSDNEILATISNDAGYDRYFTVSYSNEVVSLQLAQASLPQDILANPFIALTLTVEIRGTTHTSSAVANINIVSDNGNPNNTDGTGDDGCPMKTTYIVSIVLLSILVVGLIAAAVAFYFFKLRSKNYSNLDEERDPRFRYERNNPTTRVSDVKHTPLDERRPTGFIFKPLEEDTTTDTTNDFDKNRRKSVAFDDNVEKMQIESPIDEDNDASASDDDNNISDKSEVTHV